MVVPYDVADSAQDAVADRVIAWLESGGDVNDVDQDGFTLLNSVARGGTRSGRGGVIVGLLALVYSRVAYCEAKFTEQ